MGNQRISSVQQGAHVVYARLQAVRLARLSRTRNPCWKTLFCLYLGKVQRPPHVFSSSLTDKFKLTKAASSGITVKKQTEKGLQNEMS